MSPSPILDFLLAAKQACALAVRLDQPYFVFKMYDGDKSQYVASNERPGTRESMYSDREHLEVRPDGTAILFRQIKPPNGTEYEAYTLAAFDPARI